MTFRNRVDAGRALGRRLEYLRGCDVVVVGLPRGGVPVAYEVARALDAPLDVILVRKLGAPFQPELAMGAIGEGGIRVVYEPTLRLAELSPEAFAAVEARERAELDHRVRRLRGGRAREPLAGRLVVVVDDGIATGSTASAACQVVRAAGAARVVLAAPIAPPPVVDALRSEADEVVCVETPAAFFAIGEFYDDFSQTSEEEVLDLLHRATTEHREPAAAPVGAGAGPPTVEAGSVSRDVEVDLPALPVPLRGRLTVPRGARGAVVFAHGSGSSRHSPRNRYVADVLTEAGFATLLFDLLTPAEDTDRSKIFDIPLLARRLADVTDWLRGEPEVAGLAMGYFGASTGAAAALWAAAEEGSHIEAIVSRGGRPDLAAARLAAVEAPTLLIVGGADELVLDLNKQAATLLRHENRVAVVPGATHLFSEPGALESVAVLARDWFVRHLDLVGQHRRH